MKSLVWSSKSDETLMTTRPSVTKRDAQPDGALLITALNQRWENYQMQVKTCRREFSEEAVHDLRVSTRRSLKDQLDDLDDLRDVQVMLVEVSETIDNFLDLKPFEIHLQEREKHLLRLARKLINALKLSELKKRIEKIRESLKNRMLEENSHAQFFQAVDNVYVRTNQAFVQVDASQPSTIHRLRLAFKKFRYMAE